MNKKVLVAAVAAALAAPAAFAQSSVTIGGTVNIMYDNVRAGGTSGVGLASATVGQGNLRSHDRVRDGAGSNIRFSVIEDLGGGNSAFVQVESAVIANSDTRAANIGGAAAAVTGWGNRNSGIGIRSKFAGRFLMGVWDIHYHEHYSIDPGWIIVNSASSTLGLMNTMGNAAFGGIGGRMANVLRWDSPVWSGFSMVVNMARPSDAPPPAVANDVRDNKKNRIWNFAPRYESGGFVIVYSHNQDKDAATTAVVNPGLGNLGAASSQIWKQTSNRLGARYKFANGFGFGALWDSSKVSNRTDNQAASISVKRSVWAFPLTYEAGNHHVFGTYSRARDWRGQMGGVGLGTVTNAAVLGNGDPVGTVNYGSETGATMWNLGYNYKLSQRTNFGVSYNRIRNEKAVMYDFFANSAGLSQANANTGADPRQLAFNLRHTF